MDQQSIRFPLFQTHKIGIKLIGLPDWNRLDLDLAHLGCGLDMFKQDFAEKGISINENRNAPRGRQHLHDQLEVLCCQFGGCAADSGCERVGVRSKGD